MNHTGRMDVLETAQHLVNEKANMIVAKTLTLDNLVEIGAHQLIDEIHLGEGVQRRRWCKHIQQTDDL